MALVRFTTINGKWIEGARWELGSIGDLKENHEFQARIPVSDDDLIAYVVRNQRPELGMEKIEKQTFVILAGVVARIRHMLDLEGGKGELESMAFVVPANRLVEGVLMYLFDRESCSPKFLAAVREKRT